MSVFGKIFGGKSSKPEPTTQGALQELSEQEEMLIKKQEYLNKKIETSLATAKKHATTNKRVALKALKEKKTHEKQLEQIEGILNTISHQKTSLENAALHAEVLGVMAKTSAALKSTHKMDVDKVHDLMEEIAEQHEVSNEITQAISNPIGLQNDLDDDELLKELAEMEEAQINEQLLDVGPVPVEDMASKLPEAPKDKLPKAKTKKQEEDDLAELEAWANA